MKPPRPSLRPLALGTVLGWAALVLALPLSGAEADHEAGIEALRAGDYAAAARTWEARRETRDGRALFQLGLMYHAGLHREVDEETAVMLYHQAAGRGVVEAQEYLAAAYAFGWWGLPRNEAVARFWVELASPR